MKRFLLVILLLFALGKIEGVREEAATKVSANEGEGVMKEVSLSKEMLADLTKKLGVNKGKMKEIKLKLDKATVQDKAHLVQEEAQTKQMCEMLEKQIKDTKVKLRKLEKHYAEECLKKAETKQRAAKKVVVSLKPQIAKLLKEIKNIKETLKVAPEKSKPALIKKLNILTKKLKDLKKNMKKEKTILKSAVKEVKKEKTAKAAKVMKIKEKKLDKIKIKIEKIKEKNRAADIKITNLAKTLKIIKPKTPAEKAKAKEIKDKISKEKTKKAKLTITVKDLKIDC